MLFALSRARLLGAALRPAGRLAVNAAAAAPPAEASVAWQRLGLGDEVCAAVAHLGLEAPSAIQNEAIPGVLGGEDLLFAAETGSGKTLAYLLPVFARLKAEEFALDREALSKARRPGRPRALVLVPTRELAAQVVGVAKDVAHVSKLSVRGVFGGSDGAGSQRRKLSESPADVLVATPGRLQKLWDEGALHLSRCGVVVVDEVDTMLSQGFGDELQKILKATAARDYDAPATVVATTATLTKAVKRTFGPKGGRDPKWAFLPELRVFESSALHKATSTSLDLVDVVGRDKLDALDNVLANDGQKCLVFCNTVASCRAAEYDLSERKTAGGVFAYHGELNSRAREANLEEFREAASGVLVCTDLAARGLDVPDVGHVVMFDFPRNPVDYLHRAGRTGRAGASGKVTALVAKGDRVLAAAVARAVANGERVDQLSSVKADYQPGGSHAPARKPNSRKQKARKDLERASARGRRGTSRSR